jgi:aryl-alcohol dehydrogenase-like predicted oxidoreductase
MTQVFPVRAQGHVSEVATDAVPVPESPMLRGGIDDTPTAPLTIVAPRRLGETEIAAYPLALGTRALAEAAEIDSAQAVLDRFAQRGGNLIVTSDAHVHGLGNAIVGGWMACRGLRDRVVVDLVVGTEAEGPGLGPVNVVRSVESALRRLGTDHVDILTLQGPDAGTALVDTLATVEWLIDTGKVRYLALSGYTADTLMEARVMSSTGLPKVTAIEVPYSLMNRRVFEGDLRIATAAQGLGVLPTHPLAHGYLAGTSRSRVHLSRRGARVLHVLDRIAARHRCSVVTISIAWLLAKRGVVAPVVNVSDVRHVDQLMDAVSLNLARSEMLELDRASE